MSFETRTSASLGADLRALRKSRRMTLEEVGDRLGKSVGWLSQVERDISAPVYDDLRKMAALYDVPMSLFFGTAQAPAQEAGRIVRSHARRQVGNDAAGLVEQLLSPDLTDSFEVIHSTFKPGASQNIEQRRQTQEVAYVISGRLNLWLAGDMFDLASGDSFRIRDEPYRWDNPYDDPAVLIWVISPPVY